MHLSAFSIRKSKMEPSPRLYRATREPAVGLELVHRVLDLVVGQLVLAAMKLAKVAGRSMWWRQSSVWSPGARSCGPQRTQVAGARTGRYSVRSPGSVRLIISTSLVWPRNFSCVYFDLALRRVGFQMLGRSPDLRPPAPPPTRSGNRGPVLPEEGGYIGNLSVLCNER
jgi:hypothetical protein